MNKLLALALSLTLTLPASAQQATDPGYPTYAAPTFPLSQVGIFGGTLKPYDKIIFVGDSITNFGTNDPETPGCAPWIDQFTQIAQTCGLPGITVESFGVPGYTTVDMATGGYFASTVIPAQCSVMVIWLGINDLYGGTTPLNSSLQAMSAMINAALQNGTREVFIVSPESYGECREDQDRLDNDINWLSYQYMVWALNSYVYYGNNQAANPLHYVPMREEWRAAEGIVNPQNAFYGVLTIDGVHPSQAGHGFLANVFLKSFGLPQISGNIQAP